MRREFARIQWLRRELGISPGPDRGVELGPGDDAAVWRPPRGRELIVSVDTQIEGSHFKREWLGFEDIGRRAISAAASDLAAMGARAEAALLAVALPPKLTEREFRALFRGLAGQACDEGLAVLGGNLASGVLGVTTTVLGSVRPGQAIRRSTARAGDGIWVSGFPGRSRVGLELLARGAWKGDRRRAVRECLLAFRRPRARSALGEALARRALASALIDLSDGLAADLGELLRESTRSGSRLGAILEASSVAALLDAAAPAMRVARSSCRALAESLELLVPELVLEGGEDFELLFTSSASPRRLRGLESRLGLPIRRIGRVVGERAGIWLADETGHERRVRTSGFDHFGK